MTYSAGGKAEGRRLRNVPTQLSYATSPLKLKEGLNGHPAHALDFDHIVRLYGGRVGNDVQIDSQG
jgi:hypothetical protein